MKRALVLAAIGALCLWALYAFAYLPLTCNWTLDTLRARTRAAGTLTNDYQLIVAARDNLTALRRLEQHCRTRAEIYALEAENENNVGNKEGALQSIRRALDVDQRPELYVYAGTLLTELGRKDEAVEMYTTALRYTEESIEKMPADDVTQRAQQRVQQLGARQRK